MEGSTRRRLSGIIVACAFAATCAAAVAKSHRIEQTGTFALLSGAPQIVSKFWTSHANGLNATLKIKQFQLDGTTPILDYTVDMQRIMHLVVVRDDFATFAHLHPAFDVTSGTFRQPFTRDSGHEYYVYADTTPKGLGQQVFRFTLQSSGPLASTTPSLTVSPPTAAAGPYTVTLGQTSFSANQPLKVSITVTKGGKPASDLGTFLGAAAHAVFINTSTLAYVHVHPMVKGSMSSMALAGPHMMMMLPALPAGTYKLWIQFRGGNDVIYTAPFTVVAQ